MQFLRPELLFVFTLTILALSQPVEAGSFYCDGWWECDGGWNGCCVVAGDGHNVIPMCLHPDYLCSQECCIGGGCDTYDDYQFCPVGTEAYCGDWGIRCCWDGDYYFERTGRCVPDSWECVGDIDCADSEKCSGNQCTAVTCTADYYACDGNVKQKHTYDIYEHRCNDRILTSFECDSDDICQNGECVALECPENVPFCLDWITTAETESTPINHQCVESTVNIQVCTFDEICENAECVKLDCDDLNNCTLDDVANHQCIHIFIDADEDGVCDFYDECPETFGTGADGCPATVGEIIGAYETYYWLIPIAIAVVVGTALVIYMVALRRKPRRR